MSSTEILSQNPKILLKKSFLTAQDCKIIISNIKETVRSKVMVGNKSIVNHERTSRSIIIKNNNIVEIAKKRICKEFFLKEENCEPVVFTNYKKGEEYRKHYDVLADETYGQRIITCILYLNSCEGGETFFDNLKLTIKPSTGGLILFENCFENTAHLNPLALHSSLPVSKGEKNILTFWFRNMPFS